MNDIELTKNYEEGFIERISEPIISEPLISESEGNKLLKTVITEWLEDENYSQKEIMDTGMNIAKYIEQFDLQHLVSGGWTPLQKA